MAGVRFIVSRTQPARHAYLKRVFGERFDVIFDRRVGERRQLLERAPVERRCGDRRQRDITKDLQTLGWVPVREAN